jgi:HK97 family phage prohead protease
MLSGMPERTLDFDTELEAVKATDDEIVVEGYLATYDLDHQNERWVPGSWGDAIKGFMANPSRPVLYEHKREYGQFGTVEQLEEREGGLWGRLRLPRPAGGVLLQAWEAVKAGLTKGVSIRAPMVMSRQSDGTALCVPRRITEASITPFPINESSVVAVAQKAFEADAEKAEAEAVEDLRTYFDEKIAEVKGLLEGIEEALPSPPAGDGDKD